MKYGLCISLRYIFNFTSRNNHINHEIRLLGYLENNDKEMIQNIDKKNE